MTRTFTLEERLMSTAAAIWGMSQNMPQEVYVRNYNKILEDSGLGELKINYKPTHKEKQGKNNKRK